MNLFVHLWHLVKQISFPMQTEYKILLLDDDIQAINNIVQTFIRHETGYTLFQTLSPIMAIEIAEKMLPDIVITDWHMPEMSGIEFIKELKSREHTKDIFVIMTTALLTKATDLQIALDTGAVDFIRKPFDDIELLARTNSVLRLVDYYKTIVNNQNTITEKIAIIEKQKADILQFELDKKNSQLLANNMEMVKMIELNKQMITCLQNDYIKKNSSISPDELQIIVRKYKIETIEETWNEFQVNFEANYPDFYANLNRAIPDLSPNEKRLCAFIRMNMSVKEIALFTLQNPDSIRKARMRLRKKLNLTKNMDINTELVKITG